MINQDFYIYKFDQDCTHNCHLDIIQHKFLFLLMYLHNKIILFHCNDQHILMSIYQQTFYLNIVGYILCLATHQQNIHLDKVKHMCMSIDHPIITNPQDIVIHIFESYCQQKTNYNHIDKHICLYLDQHT